MIAEQVDPDGTVYFRVFVKPLVNLIWLAGLVFVLGSLVTLWPDAREERRLARPLRRAPRVARRGVTALALVLAARSSPPRASSRSRCRSSASPSRATTRLAEPGEDGRRRLGLAEERDRALAALKELEFDHRTGKVSDEDYRALVGPLRREAAEALKALENGPGRNG